MSASVFKPIRPPHDMARMRTPPPLDARRAAGVQQDVQKVRRALFGPVNHEESRRMAEEHLAAQLSSAISRWEFDFNKGVPLSSSTRYIWSIVPPRKEPCPPPAPTRQPLDIPENNLHLYLDPLHDLTPKTADLPARAEDDSHGTAPEQTEKMLTSPARPTKQTSITDFMTAKKSNSIFNTVKKVKRPTEASVSRPSKLPRTSNSSAS